MGQAPETQGTGAPTGDSIFAVLTNACPLGDGKVIPPLSSPFSMSVLTRCSGVQRLATRTHGAQSITLTFSRGLAPLTAYDGTIRKTTGTFQTIAR